MGESAQYLLKYNDFLESRVNADRNNWKNWNIEDIGMLLSQATCYNLSLVTEKMLNKAEGVSNLDVWNKVVGSEIKKTAFYHSLLYVFNNFRKALDKDTSIYNKAVSTNLCLLFGINSILKYSGPIIEGGFITPEQLESLANFKEVLLEKLRPHVARIVDSFLLPKSLIQSALTQGDPYEVHSL